MIVRINGDGPPIATLDEHVIRCSHCSFSTLDTGDPHNLASPGKRKFYTHWLVTHAIVVADGNPCLCSSFPLPHSHF